MVPVYQGLVEHHQTGRRALGGLRPDALEKSQRMQGIVLSRMVVKNSGNEVFAEALNEIRALGIKKTVY